MFRSAAIFLPILLAGCAADVTNYPSLARRDAERVSGTAQPAPAESPGPQTPAPPSAEVSARLAQLVDQAETAHARFRSKEARARTLAQSARGAGLGSTTWASASIALAELESARSQAMIALADLDRLDADARVEAGGSSAVTSARDRVIALVASEDLVLAELRGRLSG